MYRDVPAAYRPIYKAHKQEGTGKQGTGHSAHLPKHPYSGCTV